MKFKVPVNHVTIREALIEVEADSQDEAETKAVLEAGGLLGAGGVWTEVEDFFETIDGTAKVVSSEPEDSPKVN